MTIENGQVASADEVMNAMGSLFNDTAQNIFNADYIGFDSRLNNLGVPNLKNVFYDTDLTETFLSFGDSQYDFSGSTLDTNVWVVGGTGSSGQNEFIFVTGTNDENFTRTLISSGTSPITLVDGFYILNTEFLYSGASNGSGQIQITDGSVTINILNKSFSSESQTLRRLNLDKTNETCTFTSDLTNLDNTAIDLSSLNNGVDWFIRISATSTSNQSGGNMITRLYSLFKLNDATTNETIIDLGTSPETVTNLIGIFNDTINGSATAIYSVSVDNEVNFEVVTNTIINRPINTGTQLKLKVELSSDSSGNISQLNEYAIKYNLY